MEANRPDPVIDEIRQIRHEISAQFGHDPARLVAHYMELQKQYKDRLIGLDEEPISPVSRAETVTNRKPKKTMRSASSG